MARLRLWVCGAVFSAGLLHAAQAPKQTPPQSPPQAAAAPADAANAHSPQNSASAPPSPGRRKLLDQSIALYQEGDKLRRQCEARLKDAQARIEQIAFGSDGKPAGLKPFDAG